MPARKAILSGCRKVIRDPRSTPLQVLKAMRLYEQEKEKSRSKPSEVDKILAKFDQRRGEVNV